MHVKAVMPISAVIRDGTKLFSRNFFNEVLTLVKVKFRIFLNYSAQKIHIGQYEEKFCYSSLHLQPIKVLWESWVCISQLEFGEFSQKCPHDPGQKENREEGGCHPFWGNVSLVGPKEFGGCSNKRVSCLQRMRNGNNSRLMEETKFPRVFSPLHKSLKLYLVFPSPLLFALNFLFCDTCSQC